MARRVVGLQVITGLLPSIIKIMHEPGTAYGLSGARTGRAAGLIWERVIYTPLGRSRVDLHQSQSLSRRSVAKGCCIWGI